MIFHDIAQDLWAAATHQAMISRSTKIEKDSFKFLFADEKAQFLVRDTLELNEKLINEWKRR